MKRLLIITQKVDENDQLLGFSIGWFRGFADKFDKILILCLEKGVYDLPPNVEVISMGKDRGAGKLKILFNFYKLISNYRRDYDSVFVFMNAIWVVLGAWFWGIFSKKSYLWYAHKTITWKHRLAEKFADGIFTSTPEGFRIKSKKVFVVGQGIDTTAFRPISNFQFSISNALPLKILSVGRIAPIKNYGVLLQACKILLDKGFNFSLDIIGEPVFPEDVKYEAKLKQSVSDMGLGGCVNFLGKIKNRELPGRYQDSRLFINLGKTGSLDKTILEAMACGVNVISSNESAIKFLPQELIVKGDNPKELAEKIEEVSKKDFGLELREYVKKNHSLANLTERISSIINKTGVLVAGYPYVRENYLNTFRKYNDEFFFLLPKKWKAKGGKIVFSPPERGNVIKTKAYFYHSDYPLVGGLFKGFMPMFPRHLLKKANKVDVVYSATEPVLLSTLYQGIWAKLFGKKHVIFTWENISYDTKFKGLNGAVKKMVLWLNFKFCDGLVCGNNKAMEIHKKYKKPTAVIPLSGVDDDRFTPLSLSKKNTFLFAGALDFRKGIHLLLEAFEKTADKLPNATLKVVGSGTYEKEFKESVSNSRHQDKISIIPWVENKMLPELLNASEIFLYPSISHEGWEEQFGYSMAEASLCGLPVIATRSGSIGEVVINNKTGILVSENNVEELSEAMTRLASDTNLQKELGRVGREYISKNYSYGVVSEKFYVFFSKI